MWAIRRVIAVVLAAVLFCGLTSGADASDGGVRIKITAAGAEMFAVLEDNAASRAFTAKLPITLKMADLYGRELCYHFGSGGLPTETLRSDRYEVGDIIYWPPRGSFVILYRQNGEEFERQQIGHIESGAEIFETTGDTEVTFEISR